MFDEILNSGGEESVAPPVNLEQLQKGHRIVFLKGRAKNFRSIGNNFIETDYVQNRSTLVISDENGAGKSTTTVWLIYYAITGQPYYKKDKVTSLVNSTSRKNMVVELELMIRGTVYKIVRGRKPDLFELYVLVDDKWKQYKADAAKDDLQGYIWSLLGLEPKSGAKIIENACVLGRERFAPFLEMSAEDRRLLVESVWDLKIFRSMSDVAKQRIKDLREQARTVEHDIDLVNSDIGGVKTFLESLEAQETTFKDRLYDNEREINRLQFELAEKRDELEATESELVENGDQAVASKVKDIKQQISELETEKASLKDLATSEIEKLVADNGAQHQQLSEEVERKSSEIEELETELVGVGKSLEEKTDIEKSINERLTEVQRELEDSNEKLQKVMSFKPKVEFEEKNAKERLKKFEEMGECPQCEQVVGEDKIEQIRSEVQPKIEKAEADYKKLAKAIEEQQTRNDTAKSQVEKIRVELKEVQQAIHQLNSKQSELKMDKVRLEQSLAQSKDKLDGLSNNDELKDNVKKKVADQAREIDANIRDLNFEIERLGQGADKKLETVRNELANLDELYKTRIQAAESRKVEIEDDKLKNEESIERERENLLHLQSKETSMESEHKRVQGDIEEYEYIVDILGDKEGKADVVRMYLPYLNSKINEYLEAMNLFVALEIDDQFNATMGNPSRKGQTLFSLSTGQRARINLAIMFALRDVANLKASFHTNLFVLDEVLENLSERGVVEAIGMIKEKFSDSNVFLITQRNDEFAEHFENQLFYELRGDETYQRNK